MIRVVINRRPNTEVNNRKGTYQKAVMELKIVQIAVAKVILACSVVRQQYSS